MISCFQCSKLCINIQGKQEQGKNFIFINFIGLNPLKFCIDEKKNLDQSLIETLFGIRKTINFRI